MPSCSLIPALPPSSRSCHPLGRYGSNGARTRSSSTALPAGILTPARRSSPGSSGTGANCASTAARCRCTTSPGSPTSHIPAPASQHGPGSWQQSGASPSWSARPATTRSMPNGHQPQSRPRHKSPESRMPGNLARPVRQGGLGKGPANCGHLAVRPTQPPCGGLSRTRLAAQIETGSLSRRMCPGLAGNLPGGCMVLYAFLGLERASRGTSTCASGLPQPVTGSHPGAAW